MTQESDLRPLEAAYLQALAAEERPKLQRKKPDKKKAVPVPNLRLDTSVQFRRENSAEVAEQLAAQIEAEGVTVTVRRHTVHVEPSGARAEILAQEEQKRALVGRLRNQAVRMGRSWSRWINDGRTGGWRHIDPTLTNSWADLMAATGEHEIDTRLAIIENFADGMGLSLDDVNIYANPTRFDNNRNKVDYVQRITAQVDQMDQLTAAHLFEKGRTRAGLAVRGTGTGGFLCVSFEHLSGYYGKRQLLEQFRGFMMDKYEDIGVEKPFTARIGSIVISDWIGQKDVQAYFQRRHV